jgi:hypothetical protein
MAMEQPGTVVVPGAKLACFLVSVFADADFGVATLVGIAAS